MRVMTNHLYLLT